MDEQQESEGMLASCRVLDLADEKGLLCGKILGDLGADVIKVEKPGGDPARNIGPFYKDTCDPEKSLYWFAFNTSKRGITLDIETADGQDIFKRLVKSADIVIESFPPGYMNKLGLGYSSLSQINPGIVLTSITPFGQSGPYKDYKTSDLVTMAMGGVLYVTGDADRCPVRISFPVAYQFAGTEAALGTVMALYHRNLTGEGQQVDISTQWSVLRAQYDVAAWWVAVKRIYTRHGPLLIRPNTGIIFRQHWPCKDGFVTFYYFGGPAGAASNRALVEWMDEEKFDVAFMKDKDWPSFDYALVTQEEVNRMEVPTGKFFKSHTKKELYDGAIQRGVMLYPAATPKDMLESQQLAYRKFWVKAEHPELGTEITYPGAFVKASETTCEIRRCAPLIGEHNEDVYQKELGLSHDELLTLKQSGVI